MAISRIYSLRTSQPRSAASVIGLWNVVCSFNELANRGSQPSAFPVLAVGAELTQTPWGGAVRVGVNASDRTHVQLGSSAAVQRSTQSGIIVYVPSQVGSASTLYTTSDNTSAQAGFTIQQQASGTIELSKHNTATILVSAGVVVANRINVVAWSYDGPSGRAVVAVNGVLTTGTSAQTFTHGTTLLGRYRLSDSANSQPASILLFAMSPLEARPQEVLGRARNPWQQVFGSVERGIWAPAGVAAGSDVSVSLTGQAAAFSAGSITPAEAIPLTGQAITSAAGTIAPVTGLNVALTGQSAAFSAGSVAPSSSVALSGQPASFSAGSIVPAESVALSGQAATFSAGTVTPAATNDVSVTLSGVAASFIAGLVGTLGGDAAVVSTGAGRPRRRRFQVEIDGNVYEVSSADEAQAVLEQAKEEAQQVAKVAIERAAKAKRRPVKKVLADARKALVIPDIQAPPELSEYVGQLLDSIRTEYTSALNTIEIAAYLARRDREIEEDDEEIFLLL